MNVLIAGAPVFQIFTPRTRLIRGVVIPGQVDYIRRTYVERLATLRQYYQSKTFYLRNQHPLIRLLVSGMGSLHTDYSAFVHSLTDRTDSLVRHFQYTGSASYGKVHYGEYYGEGCYEIVLSDDSNFDIERSVVNWKSLEPVQVLTHPVSDLGLSLPNGNRNRYLEGLAVVSVHIPMLFLQYRRFIEEQIQAARSTGNEPITSPRLFLYRYVLPNMMTSHVDHVFVNRLINLFEGRPMTSQIGRSAFFQAEAGNVENSGLLGTITDAQEGVLKGVVGARMQPDQVLASIFTVSQKNALDLLVMPDIAPTRQAWWALLLARLKHVEFLLKLDKERNVPSNRMYYNRVLIDYGRLVDSRVLERVLPNELLDSTLSTISDVLEMAGA